MPSTVLHLPVLDHVARLDTSQEYEPVVEFSKAEFLERAKAESGLSSARAVGEQNDGEFLLVWAFLEYSNALGSDAEKGSFRVTHPFHPLCGRQYVLVTYRRNWGMDRVYFHNEAGTLCSLPAAWTSVAPPDPVVALGQGRSLFRVEDLLVLSRLIQGLHANGTRRTRLRLCRKE